MARSKTTPVRSTLRAVLGHRRIKTFAKQLDVVRRQRKLPVRGNSVVLLQALKVLIAEIDLCAGLCAVLALYVLVLVDPAFLLAVFAGLHADCWQRPEVR